jgi:hypothetical protein
MTKGFLDWERTTKDVIDFKRSYVDVAGGDLRAGVLLSQIIYWSLPDKAGKSNKLRVRKNERFWLVKTRKDWWAECRLRPREFDGAIALRKVFAYSRNVNSNAAILPKSDSAIHETGTPESRNGNSIRNNEIVTPLTENTSKTIAKNENQVGLNNDEFSLNDGAATFKQQSTCSDVDTADHHHPIGENKDFSRQDEILTTKIFQPESRNGNSEVTERESPVRLRSEDELRQHIEEYYSHRTRAENEVFLQELLDQQETRRQYETQRQLKQNGGFVKAGDVNLNVGQT